MAGCIVVAAPLLGLACQDQGRPDSMPNGMPGEKVSQAPMKLDDATKTNIVLRELHAANVEEIDLGKLAGEKAKNADVKSFAADMVKDHGEADAKLVALAKRSNIELGAGTTDPVEKALSDASEECKRSLRGLSGSSFDVAYMAPQADKHVFALKLVDEGSKTASGDVKSLLQEMRPTVEGHLDHARNVMQGLSFSGAIGGGPQPREHEWISGKHDGGRERHGASGNEAP
jgi:predicted outer membrane protein